MSAAVYPAVVRSRQGGSSAGEVAEEQLLFGAVTLLLFFPWSISGHSFHEPGGTGLL